MVFEVQVKCVQTIKPSSPTPPHLQTHKLSFLDQLSPKVYIPLIFFYPSEIKKIQNHEGKLQDDGKSHILRKSLSKALNLFHPLAGRINVGDHISLSCNDEGVGFVEARVTGQLAKFLRQPDMDVLGKFLPYHFSHGGRILPCGDALLAVQVSLFDCGGMAIGVNVSHLIADLATMVTFINSWAAMARGSHHNIYPIFDAASLLPPSNVPRSPPTNASNVRSTLGNVATRRFLLSGAKISSLQDKCSRHSLLARPSRVEAVSALIWRSIVRSRRDTESIKAFVAVHVMDLRSRMEPPLPQHSFGNITMAATTSEVRKSDCQGSLQGFLEKEIRDAIRKVGSEVIKELQGPDGYKKTLQQVQAVEEYYLNYEVDLCIFSSWVRFPLYEADFGWGKPFWVSRAPAPTKNVVVLMDSPGGGIEAWVSMEMGDLAKLEQDQELASFASLPIV